MIDLSVLNEELMRHSTAKINGVPTIYISKELLRTGDKLTIESWGVSSCTYNVLDIDDNFIYVE